MNIQTIDKDHYFIIKLSFEENEVDLYAVSSPYFKHKWTEETALADFMHKVLNNQIYFHQNPEQ